MAYAITPADKIGSFATRQHAEVGQGFVQTKKQRVGGARSGRLSIAPRMKGKDMCLRKTKRSEPSQSQSIKMQLGKFFRWNNTENVTCELATGLYEGELAEAGQREMGNWTTKGNGKLDNSGLSSRKCYIIRAPNCRSWLKFQ